MPTYHAVVDFHVDADDLRAAQDWLGEFLAQAHTAFISIADTHIDNEQPIWDEDPEEGVPDES